MSLSLFFTLFNVQVLADDRCRAELSLTPLSRELAQIRPVHNQLVPEIKCFSERMISIRDKNDAQMAPAQLTAYESNGNKDLRFRDPANGELIYSLADGSSVWESTDLTEAIVVEKENIGVRRLRYAQAPERGSVFRQLPTRMRRVFTSLERMGKAQLNEELSLCAIADPSERDFREKMLPEEVNQCKQLISKVKSLIDCQEIGNCSEVYVNKFAHLAKGEAPARMNHEHMYEVNRGLSKREKVIGGLLAVDYAVSYSIWGSLAFMAARGYKVVKAATAWGIVSNALTFIWPFAFDFENCKPESEGGTIDDCRALSPKRMSSNFQAQLSDIIMEPDQFNSIANSEDGGLGRVVCLSMEALYLQEIARFTSLPEVTCSKHTMEIGHRNYLIMSDGHLSGIHSGRERVHFYSDGGFFLENTDTGESRDLLAQKPVLDSFSIYSEYLMDYRELSLLKPRIEEALQSEDCKRLPALHDDFVRKK